MMTVAAYLIFMVTCGGLRACWWDEFKGSKARETKTRISRGTRVGASHSMHSHLFLRCKIFYYTFSVFTRSFRISSKC